MAELAPDTLFLACTRPVLKRGVPAEGYWANLLGCLLLGMLVNRPGLTEPCFLLAVPVHYLMRFQTDRNPNWVSEWRAWWRTLGTATSRTFWALTHAPGERTASHV